MDREKVQRISIQHYSSPCGELVLASMGHELCLCDWSGMACAKRNIRRIGRYMNVDFRVESSPIVEQTKRQLDDYFAGNRKEFDIQLHTFGTDFQNRVWKALLDIPYGKTRTYMEIAKSIDNAKGVRAVAQAIGANSLDIIVPCHRVIGSNHSMTGYTGGLDKKKFLIELERR